MASWVDRPSDTDPYFSLTVISGDVIITGDNLKMKTEIGFNKNFAATPVGGVPQEGSAVWSYQASDADGNDVSGDFVLTVNPDDEFKVNLQHLGSTESTGLLTIRADGDADLDEEALVIGTLDIVTDSPNVTAFEIEEETGEIDNTLPTPPTGIDNELPTPPPEVDNTLPTPPPEVDNTLPEVEPGIDNELPEGRPERPDQGLPEGFPERPDQGLPEGRPERPDQGLPEGLPERPDQGLPPSGGIDNELPETPEPKKRK